MKKVDESKTKDLRKQQRKKKAMEQEQIKKEVEERKLKRAVEKAEKFGDKRKIKNKVKKVHQNLILQEKRTVGFLGGMRMVIIYLASDTKNGKNYSILKNYF